MMKARILIWAFIFFCHCEVQSTVAIFIYRVGSLECDCFVAYASRNAGL